MSEPKPELTMRDIGRRGGAVTAEHHGHEFYERIGRKGGERVKALIAKAKAAEAQEARSE